MSKNHAIGKIKKEVSSLIGSIHNGKPIIYSDGLRVHVGKNHPNCLKYITMLSSIINSPDYIGINPRETDASFEIVKIMDANVRAGIKIDRSQDYFYVATIYTITEAKLSKNIKNGRLIKA